MACRIFYKARNGKRSKLFDTVYDIHGASKAKEVYVGIRTRAFKKWYGNWEIDSMVMREKLDSNREPTYESIQAYDEFNIDIKELEDLPFEDRGVAKKKIERLQEVFHKAGVEVEVVFDTTLKSNAILEAGGKKIRINPFKMRKDTTIHEFAHIYVDLLGYENPHVQQAIKELRNSTLYAQVRGRYGELASIEWGNGMNALDKEVLVTAMGREGVDLFDHEGKVINVKEILKSIIQAIANLFGVRYNTARKLATQMVNGSLGELKGEASGYVQHQRSKKSTISELNDANLKEGLELNTNDPKNTYYENSSGKLERATEWSSEKFSTLRTSEEYAQRETENLYTKRGLAFSESIEWGSETLTFDDVKESILEGYATGREFGTATHVYLEWLSTEDPSKKRELENRFRDIIAGNTGGKPIIAKHITWISKAKEKIWKVAGIVKAGRSSENVSPAEAAKLEASEDKIATEIMISNDDLGIATTIDMLAEAPNGVLSIVDWKAGIKFRNDASTMKILKYQPSLKTLQDTKLNRAKLEVALRALMVKVKFPDAKFDTLRIVHINKKDIAVGYDVELGIYLEVLSKYILDTNPELHAEYESKGIFNAVEYTGVSDLSDDIEHDIDSEMTLEERITKYKNDLNAHYLQHPEHTKEHNPEYVQKLYKKIADLEAGSATQKQNLNEYGDLDVGSIKRWLGNLYDVGNSRLQQFGKILFRAKDKARKEIHEINTKHDALLRPILEDYKRKHSLTSLTGVNFQELYGFMFTHSTEIGHSGYFLISEDSPNWRALTPAQKEYINFFRSEISKQYKLTMQEKLAEGQQGRPITRAELMGADPTLPKDFLPRMPLSAAEVRERHGRMSSEYLKYQKTRYANNYFDAELYSRGAKVGMLPVKFLGNQEVISDENHTLSAEMMFKGFIGQMIFKRHMDPVASLGEALATYFRIQRDAYDDPSMKPSADFLKDQLDLHVYDKPSKLQLVSNKFGLSLGKFKNHKGEEEYAYLDADKVLRGMKHWTSAAAMWVKPVAGTANHALITMLNSKEAAKGSFAKRLGIEEEDIDYTISDLVKAEGLIIEMAKDFMIGEGKKNKLWVMAKKLNYLTDNYDYAVRNRDMIAPKSKVYDQANLYIFHQIGEDHGSLMLLAAQLLHRKNQKTGKSMWDSYDKEGNWVGGVRGRVQIGETSNGDPIYRELTEMDDRETTHLKRVSQRIHGSYRQDERVALELYALGHWVLQFKKYFPTILFNMFQGKRRDMSLGSYKLVKQEKGEDIYEFVERINEGRVLIMLKMIGNITSLRSDPDYNWSNLDSESKQHMIEVFNTLFILAGWFVANATVIDDDDEFWNSNWGKLIQRKAGEDLSQGYHPMDLIRNFRDTTIVIPRLYSTIEAFTLFISDGVVGGKKLRNGRMPGETMLRKNLPFFATWEEVQRYFGHTKSTEVKWWESSAISRAR